MKLTVLGSGTCASQLPGVPNRYPPGFMAEYGNKQILFDCSESIRLRLEQAGFKYADIHHIAISHIHPDHFALVHFLQSVFCYGIWGDVKNEDITVYGPQEVKAAYPGLVKTHVSSIDKLAGWPHPKFKIPTEQACQIGEGVLTAKNVYHEFGLVDALAFRLETPEGVFVYSGDTGECEGIREVCANADIFVCEASARIGDEQAPNDYGHLNPRVAGNIAKEGNVKKLVLFHHTGLDSDQAILEDCKSSGFKGEIIIAKDFQVIEN